MAKPEITPGKTVNPAPRIDLDIVGPKGKNLSGPPRSAGIKPATNPGKKGFNKIRKFTGGGRRQ